MSGLNCSFRLVYFAVAFHEGLGELKATGPFVVP